MLFEKALRHAPFSSGAIRRATAQTVALLARASPIRRLARPLHSEWISRVPGCRGRHALLVFLFSDHLGLSRIRPGPCRQSGSGSERARDRLYGHLHLCHASAHLADCLLRRRGRSEEHTSELQSRGHLVCRLLLEKKKVILVSEVSV